MIIFFINTEIVNNRACIECLRVLILNYKQIILDDLLNRRLFWIKCLNKSLKMYMYIYYVIDNFMIILHYK